MKIAGMSLVEILVALLLSSLIMLSLAQMYLGCKRRFQIAEVQLAEAFDLQWVSTLLRESVRQAGFTPCLGLDQLEHDQKQIPPALSIENPPLQGISIHRMAMHFNKVLEFQSSTQLLVSADIPIHLNQPLIIADCYHAEICMPEDLRKVGKLQVLSLQKPLHYDYFGSTWLGEWIDEKWFIKANQHKKKTLFYQQQQRSQELTPLIHSLTATKHQLPDQQWLNLILGLDSGLKRALVIRMPNA